VNAISGVLANELAPRKIRVNVVSPGFVVTAGTHTAGFVGTDIEAGLVAQTLLGRASHPDDIAGVVTFLASDNARWLTGEVITASGVIR
jgi:3-oxoacyl-[acyl-carrier protein] reductase